jgi:hypothetical protein
MAWLRETMAPESLSGQGLQFHPPPRVFHESAEPFFVSLDGSSPSHGVRVGVSPGGAEADIDLVRLVSNVDHLGRREDHQNVTEAVRTAAEAQYMACR